MADQFDVASERETLDRELAIKAALTKGRSAMAPKGTCYNCAEPLEHANNLFCDNDCGQDYERRLRNKRH